MSNYLELVVREAVCPELAQALVMMYCRFLCQPGACQALRAMLSEEKDVVRQLDALDELHADFPFTHLNPTSLDEELTTLYVHNWQLGSTDMLRQLRMLCRHDPYLLAAFDRYDEQPAIG
jgi:hypothetical protein